MLLSLLSIAVQLVPSPLTWWFVPCEVHNNRVGHPKFNPAVISLGVSRAIGDIAFKHDKFTNGKPSGLIAEPEITVCSLQQTYVACTFLLCPGALGALSSWAQCLCLSPSSPSSTELTTLLQNGSSEMTTRIEYSLYPTYKCTHIIQGDFRYFFVLQENLHVRSMIP